jgi:hypothetical protein
MAGEAPAGGARAAGTDTRIVLVAGETSGDNLGAGLIEALRARRPELVFEGIAGPRMRAAGCTPWADAERLSVMGLVEVLRHLPDLFRLRREIEARTLAARPALFIGIDSPEFNLSLAARLKRQGLPTVQYVSPQVWAWRQGRVAKMALREALLRRPRPRRGVRRPPAGRSPAARTRSRGGARDARAPLDRPRGRAPAREPPGRGRTPGG